VHSSGESLIKIVGRHRAGAECCGKGARPASGGVPNGNYAPLRALIPSDFARRVTLTFVSGQWWTPVGDLRFFSNFFLCGSLALKHENCNIRRVLTVALPL
jgi:hypothetical protein